MKREPDTDSTMAKTATQARRKLTIGMPVYNGASLIAETLASLQAQTFTDFEIVVCDNASTDETAEIVARFAQNDPRIKYVANEANIGANGNFSKVANLAEAPYFKWAAHDDLYAPTYLEKCIALMERDPGIVLAHADSAFIDESGDAFPPGDGPRSWTEPATGALYTVDPIDLAEADNALTRFREVLYSSLWGTHMFGVIRTDALRQTRLIQDVPSSDRPLLAELALLGRFKTVREPLYFKRFHSRMTLALTEAEIRAYVSARGERYWKRRRQLAVFLATPNGKPVSWLTRNLCRGLVLAYGLGVAVRSARGVRHQAIRPPECLRAGAAPNDPSAAECGSGKLQV